MRSQLERDEVDRLVAAGLNDCEISRRLGIPRSTVRDMRRKLHVKSRRHLCPRCWHSSHKGMVFSAGDYAEPLGFYLGDGCLARAGRVWRLRVALDSKYPGIIRDASELLARCFPDSEIGVVMSDEGACTNLSLYSAHLPCLFPQHGPGRKHERPIVLETWQARIVADEPWRLMRGLIRTDGCSFVNRTGPYRYLSFQFSNKSDDIRDLFIAACLRVGVSARPAQDYVRINRRECVEKMVAHVGVKQ